MCKNRRRVLYLALVRSQVVKLVDPLTINNAEEDWHMPIESSQYIIILFRVNQVFTFYHFIHQIPSS